MATVSLFATLCGSFQLGYHLALLNAPLAQVAQALGFDAQAFAGLVTSALLVGWLLASFPLQLAHARWGPRQILVFSSFPLMCVRRQQALAVSPHPPQLPFS